MKKILKYLLFGIISLLVSCFIFGYEFKIEDGYFTFEWGLYHYLKRQYKKLGR